MEKKSGGWAYLTALIPGVGYMYLGLKRKGIQALILYVLISPVLDLVGLQFLGVIKLVFWFYTFFDTINLAARIDKGEFIPDSDFFIFDKLNFGGYSNSNEKAENPQGNLWNNSHAGLTHIAGWGLIALGLFSIINHYFKDYAIYDIIKHNLNLYFIPVLFVILGVYILIKNSGTK
jgi:TM2 domain-containing membrane protein YozV